MNAQSLPLVSVRVPAYNHEQYIKRCLNSVIADDYPNKELVIINDGSTDRTHEIIQRWINRYAGPMPVIYHSRENRGLSATLNELIKYCNGEFLVSLASDDCLLPGGVLKRINYLLAHPEKLAVIGDCIVIDENDKKLYDSGLSELYSANLGKYSLADGLKEEIIGNWSIPGPVLLVNQKIYELLGNYDENLRVEDWDFYLRMVSKDLLGYVDFKVSAYRVHSQGCCRYSIREKRAAYRQLLKTALKNIHIFHGYSRRLMVRQILVYLWGIGKSVFQKKI